MLRESSVIFYLGLLDWSEDVYFVAKVLVPKL